MVEGEPKGVACFHKALVYCCDPVCITTQYFILIYTYKGLYIYKLLKTYKYNIYKYKSI